MRLSLTTSWPFVTFSADGFNPPLTTNHPDVVKYLSDYQPTLSGVSVNEKSALQFSAVFAAVSFIAAQRASLPFILYKQDGDSKVRDTENRLYALLRTQPNPEMSAFVFHETMTAHLLLWGFAAAEIEWDMAGRPKALWLLHPSQVTPVRNGATLVFKVSTPGVPDAYLPASDILYVPGLSMDGITPMSVVGMARESIALGLAMERFSASFYGNGCAFGGVFNLPPTATPEQEKDFRARIESQHQGLNKAHRFLVIRNGVSATGGKTFEPLQAVPPKDAEFLQSREFSVVEVARWFGLPPIKLQVLTGATFTNSEQQDLTWAKDRLRPLCVRFESEFNRKLCSGSRYTEHLMDAVYRADSQTRWSTYQIARQIGAMSTNEIRRAENLNPIPGGDDYTPLFNGSDPQTKDANANA